MGRAHKQESAEWARKLMCETVGIIKHVKGLNVADFDSVMVADFCGRLT